MRINHHQPKGEKMKVEIYNPDMTVKQISATIKTHQENGIKELYAHWTDEETKAPCSVKVKRIGFGLYREIVFNGFEIGREKYIKLNGKTYHGIIVENRNYQFAIKTNTGGIIWFNK